MTRGKRRWRLIEYAEFDGATNMAIDEAMLEAHLEGRVPPTLRLYGFKSACVSIGHSQTLPDEVASQAKALGYDVVRRPTGGRAVLHLDDLTYSFVGSSSQSGNCEDGFLSESVLGAYRQICRGLQLALQMLGLETELGDTQVPYRDLNDCFAATTGSDLHFNGKKIVGSAQLRRRHAVLQHGSLLLNQDQNIMRDLFASAGHDRDKPSGQRMRHANLFEMVGRRVDMTELQDCFRKGFSQAFGVEFEAAPLTDEELLGYQLVRS